MKKQKSKKKKQRKPLDELLQDKPWREMVECMPPAVQRLTYIAIDAYEHENIRRMEQAVSDIKDGDTRRLRLLLACLNMEKGLYGEAAAGVEALIGQEEGHSKDKFAEPICEINMCNILNIPASVRVEGYKVFLAVAYNKMGDFGKSMEVLEDCFPMQRKCTSAYQLYESGLISAGKYEKGRDIAKEMIRFLREGEYGTDYIYQYFNTGFVFSEELDEKFRIETKNGKNAMNAMLILTAYQGLMECDVCLGDMGAYDSNLKEAADYVKSLAPEIKYSVKYMNLLGLIITEIGDKTDDEKWREPFLKLLDLVDHSGYFSKEHDEEQLYDDLIPSGYRVLEVPGYEADVKIHKFIGDMLSDMVNGLTNGDNMIVGAQDAYFYRMTGYTAAWNLCRYCIESDGLAELKDTFDYVKKAYTYTADIIEDEVRRILDNPEAVMARMADKLMKESKGWRVSRDEMELELEGNYFKTLKRME